MKITKFGVVDYLNSEEAIAAYLSAVMEENAPNLLVVALGDIARARGMAKLAEDAGLNRESLYKTLHSGAEPRFYTVLLIMKAININICHFTTIMQEHTYTFIMKNNVYSIICDE